ncbi:amino acid/amide ABC transporter substrate-binding protein, HAAT family (TC 3.A.1.4.-) [Belnapia rosea]|uniref:Amino acid/amide ABC transporter substrate-binding protein, HAAT family (TC 3.A.1.4.-) n=2 Tax=Belnapia rosea TaxID=938405 RepID=A0A1G6Y8S4_9PROT|nr:amino acid/amide ABC transporter substrate-binding protein, HAAT family (TC 3.A.1.4.-) [Belnapia rosea]
MHMLGTRRMILAGGGALAMAGAWHGVARAQARAPLRLGILGDLSGPYRDLSGLGTMASVRQAIEDLAGAGTSLQVEILHADHQHKADVGAAIARQWYDREGVDAILEVNNSAIALAVADLAREKDKVFLATGPATADLHGPRCGPNHVHWTYDTWMLAHGAGTATVRAGGDSWFFLTADYAFGHALQRDTQRAVEAAGGRVLGQARYPFPQTTDYSSFLLQAQASRAKVLGLANAGTDTVNSVKQAHEFGLTRRMKLVGLLCLLGDVRAMGAEAAQGLLLTEPFYWDLNDRTRALTRRLLPKMPTNIYPSTNHAGAYSAVLHYLKAAAAMGPAQAKASGRAAITQMKAMPTDDDAFGPGRVREDGRKIHPVYLFEVKAPAEVKAEWDLYRLAGTIDADQAMRPLSEGGCPLVRS